MPPPRRYLARLLLAEHRRTAWAIVGHLPFDGGHAVVVIREYRVEGLARRGERSDSEDDAVQRLRALRHEAELAERRATAVPPKVSLPAGFFRVRD